MRILNPIDKLFSLKERIIISSADRWFPTTSSHHSAKNKIGISGETGSQRPKRAYQELYCSAFTKTDLFKADINRQRN